VALRSIDADSQTPPTVVDAIVGMLKVEEDSEAYEARKALVRLKRTSVPHLANVLKRADSASRIAVLTVLREIGKDASSSTGILIELTSNADAEVRDAAVRALGSIGDKSAVTAIIHVVESDPECRSAAVAALQECGPPAARAVPTLTRIMRTAMDDKTDILSSDAARALASIGRCAVPSLKDIADPGNKKMPRLRPTHMS
jgi:HEAT repeat protein